MTSRTKVNSRLEDRTPNVFERLSKQQNNRKKNKSVQDSNRPHKSLSKTGSSSPVKRKSPTYNERMQKNQDTKNKLKSSSTALKREADIDSYHDPYHDSYHEKVLMENVPEKTDKDIDESFIEEIFVNESKNSLENIPKINSVMETYSELPSVMCNILNLSPPFKAGVNDSVISDTSERWQIEAPSELPLENYKSKLNSYQLEFNDIDNSDVENTSFIAKSKNSQNVIDDDKDLCDAESELDENEFYKVKVQTRLVSYENSTLFIKNTSKQFSDSQSDSDSSSFQDHSSLKQTLGSNVESDCSSLRESLSSASLQSSVSTQEPSVNETTVTHFPVDKIQGEQTTLSNVKSKLGRFMSKGKVILSDMYNSPYVPDVKSSLHKFQGITRRSFKTITFPKGMPFPQKGEDCINIDKKPDTDSGFSSLILGEQSISSEDKSINKLHLDINLDDNRTGHEPNAPFNTNESRVTSKTQSQYNEHEAHDQDESRTDYSNFFYSCSCQKVESTLRSTTEHCSCQQESEFPLEIKELLDADYARMWWTITGNFGNILPIDWSKTYTRQKYLPVLNLNETKKLEGNMESVTPSPRDDDDEEVAHDLDLHQLILAGTQTDSEPVKSAEEVIKEIDDIMQEGSSSEDEGIDATSSTSKDSVRSELQQLPPPLYHDKLKDLSVNELNETLMELELVIRRYSETLISQLALRDELEYEKELKNTFISLLLQVQNKRRNFNVEKKKSKKTMGPNGTDLKYLTTVIPYDVGHGPPDNETIQILIKILKAINEDSPTVPTLLTDYILRVLCPS